MVLERHTFRHGALMEEFRINQPEDFGKFLRMDHNGSFKHLVHFVNTKLLDAIPLLERLSASIRFLATGNIFEDLKFLTDFRFSKILRTISERIETINITHIYGRKSIQENILEIADIFQLY